MKKKERKIKPLRRVKVKWGRPSKYNDGVLDTTKQYLEDCIKGGNTPFVEELALLLGVTERTLFNWEKKHKRYTRLHRKMVMLQKLDIKKKALSGQYVNRIAAIILSSDHNIVEVKRREHTGKDGEPIDVKSQLTPKQEKVMAAGIATVVKNTLG